MGEIVEFPSNGSTGTGYLATPASGEGPGVVVIQEWWGLVDHIKDVCERFAAEGFVALAPDLYHGQTTAEPDEAGKHMMSLNIEQAAKDMSGAVDYARDRSTATGGAVAVVGYCMGGALALLIATKRPDAVKAVAPYYGVIGWPAEQPDWENLGAAVQGHYAEKDDLASPDKVRELEQTLKGLGKEVEMFIYPNAEHAFFNDSRPEVHNPEASKQAWDRTIAFFRQHLG